ncbi:MAG: NIPSNAP family protein [Planctomycetaceae bacterium]|jgi:hypothetical protein|nr:NIPSNAP family protein [Planctomycetaceae bacterium]
MKRRDFITAAAAAGVTAAVVTDVDARPFANQNAKPARQFLELRTYHVKNDDNKKILTDTIDNALIPALKRNGIGTVGAFTWYNEIDGNDKAFENVVFVLIQHPTTNSFLDLSQRLLADKTFVKAAAPVLDVPLAKSVYETYESSLLHTFRDIPSIEKPVKSDSRFYQMRCYKSFNLDRNARKIQMFGAGGELKIFNKYGLRQVFFGETVFGQRMPNLTYMLGFETQDAQKEAWKKFGSSPEWNELRVKPEYKETATSIVNLFLKPTKGSTL